LKNYFEFLETLALIFAQRAFCAVRIFAFVEADMVCFLTGLAVAGTWMAAEAALIFAQRAFCAARILSLPEADMVLVLAGLATAGAMTLPGELKGTETRGLKALMAVSNPANSF